MLKFTRNLLSAVGMVVALAMGAGAAHGLSGKESIPHAGHVAHAHFHSERTHAIHAEFDHAKVSHAHAHAHAHNHVALASGGHFA